MKQTAKRLPRCAEIAWIAGIVFCSLGVCLSANSGFGVSMVAAPAYVLFSYLSTLLPWITFGITEYILQGVMLVLLAVILRRFKWKYPLAFLTGVLYGLCLDGWRMLFGQNVYDSMALRVAAAVAGAVITAFAIACFLRSYLPQQVYELIVKEVVDKYHFPVGKVKWIYDISSLVAAVVMMLVFFRRFDPRLVGIATLVLTVVNTPMITLWGKLIDRFCGMDPVSGRFFRWFEKHFN